MKARSGPVVAELLLVALAVGLICFGGVRVASAAPRIQSNAFGAEVVLDSISTSLVETNADHTDKVVAAKGVDAGLLEGLVPDGQSLTVGVRYLEELSVVNDGSIPQYVRVTVYRSWADKSGTRTDLDPSLIEIGWNLDGWVIDRAASTPERTVLYYQEQVAAHGGTTKPLCTYVSVSPKTLEASRGPGSYDYDGVTLQIKAQVDAVQTHNEQEAMTGAWGRTVWEGQ